MGAREKIVKSLRFARNCPNYVRKRRSYQKYEFHNCYGRFYIAVINGRIPFKKVGGGVRSGDLSIALD